jgi:hypothetical protein
LAATAAGHQHAIGYEITALPHVRSASTTKGWTTIAAVVVATVAAAIKSALLPGCFAADDYCQRLSGDHRNSSVYAAATTGFVARAGGPASDDLDLGHALWDAEPLLCANVSERLMVLV